MRYLIKATSISLVSFILFISLYRFTRHYFSINLTSPFNIIERGWRLIYPDDIIDGEIGYDMILYDSFFFYFSLIFLIIYLILKLINKTQD